ncbi:MAG: hypothetical protein COA73_11975 [Candidatus Hydrogenedentota bacterium]|nr:MAG: hypothetical protein COA73_11975 [Candidatus Hydrogenedentota bacterium]
MQSSHSSKFLKNSSIRTLLLRSILIILTIVVPLLVYKFTTSTLVKIDERAEQTEKENREQEILERLTNPKSGTTPELIAALDIGMTGKEVQSTLKYPYRLEIEMFPYNHTYHGLDWFSKDIAIKGFGYVQAVFIERQLVGIGSLDSNVGRICGGCLEDMLLGERPRQNGLPYHVDGKCPVCGSEKVVPFGSRWARYNNSKNICCNVNVPMFPYL